MKIEVNLTETDMLIIQNNKLSFSKSEEWSVRLVAAVAMQDKVGAGLLQTQ